LAEHIEVGLVVLGWYEVVRKEEEEQEEDEYRD